MENVNAETMVYKVTKSKAVCGMTIFSVALVVCVFAFAYAVSLIEPIDGSYYILVPVTVLTLGVMGAYYLYSPKRVELTADALVLHRVMGPKAFPYTEIEEVGKWSGSAASLLRTFGDGGMFGCIGWFSGGGLGRHFEYVCKYDDAFYLKMRSGRKYMLSYLQIMMTISSILAIRSRTRDNMDKKNELWAYLKERDRWLYRRLRYSTLGVGVNLHTSLGNRLTEFCYKVIQRFYGFN